MSAESKQTAEPGETPELKPVAESSAAAQIVEDSSQQEKGKSKAKEQERTVSTKELQHLFDIHPELRDEIQKLAPDKMQGLTSKLEQMLLTASGKNAKDMGEFKFWRTQPVPKFNEEEEDLPDGHISENIPEKVRKDPYPMLDSFEWVTMDLNDETQMNEVYTLLSGHYVEDDNATFRFNYSAAFLNWALKAPGWLPQWHIGVRAKPSKKLCAFISGIPVNIRVRENTIRCPEINFLCIHKKLRSKRLAPVLIKEITRRCNLENIWTAVYTGGVVLPKPIASCRYFHRSLDWLKLYEVGFSPLPSSSTKDRQVRKYRLPDRTSTPGLREMETKDVKQVHALLDKYLMRFDIAPVYTEEEIEYWFLHKGDGERVIWAYVVEDPSTKAITDFFSFYSLQSSVIQSSKHSVLRAAYMYYYASEAAFEEAPDTRKHLKLRLKELINDALIIAKKAQFDVFNALSLLDNGLFITDLKFGAGDGLLHYYLYNWRTRHIDGGIKGDGKLDEENGSGVGLVML
ncbi:acyl-CoA N-acyltransferase [Kalaharituber pfeilii]|nr:acyl-CoA N-acyltransferase [Kalaharituber pfeilii]